MGRSRLREFIRANKAELLAYLSEWNEKRAIAIEEDADALVERVGVDGTHPGIQAASVRCTQAHAREDMAGVRTACHLVEDLERRLAAADPASRSPAAAEA